MMEKCFHKFKQSPRFGRIAEYAIHFNFNTNSVNTETYVFMLTEVL